MPNGNPTIIDIALVVLSLALLAAIGAAWLWRAWRTQQARKRSEMLLSSASLGTQLTFPLSPEQETIVRRRLAELEAQRANTHSPPAATPAPQDSTPLLPAPRWLAIVNDRPDQVPHLAVYGPSGVGKTTLVQGIVAQRGGKLCIIDPKPTPPTRRKWGGLPYLKIDRDGSYRTIATGLTDLRSEFNRRLVALEEGETLEPLTVIIDEYKLLARTLKDLAPQLYIDLSDLGRELHMRLIVLSTTRSVKGLGIAGMGDTRDNFVTIEIDRQHNATLEFDDETYTLDTASVVAAAGQPFPAERWWSPPDTLVDRLLSSLFAEASIPVSETHAAIALDSALAQRTSTLDTASIIAQDAIDEGTDEETSEAGVPATLTDEAIRTLYSAGWSRNKIAAMLRGSKPKRLAIINQALAALEAAR